MEFRRMVKSFWFVAGVAIITVLCFLSGVYFSDQGSFTVIQLFETLIKDADSFDMNQYQLIVILRRMSGGYLALFAPVVTALPFVITFYAEKKSGFKRAYIFRQKSAITYYIKKCIAGVICGGLMMVLGICLFNIIFYGMDLILSGKYGYEKIKIGGSVIEFIGYYAGAFVYGVMSSILSIIICFFCRNMYFIICLPFIISYLYNIEITYLISRFIKIKGNVGNIGVQVVENMANYAYLGMFEEWSGFIQMLIQVVLALGLLYFLIFIYNRTRLDRGE